MIDVSEDTFREAMARVAASDDGRMVLSWIRDYCFHNGTAFVRGSMEDTYANAARQDVYRALRTFIRPENLKSIEYDYRIVKERKRTKND